MIGNALEVVEAIKILRGEGPEDLRQLCLELAGWMFQLGGVANTVTEGKKRSEKLIASGKALDKFRQMVELQGGDPRVIDDPQKLPQARHTMALSSSHSGYLSSIECEQIGTACVILGGGRERKEDSVDPTVGIVLHKKVGDAVSVGEPLATILYSEEVLAHRASELLVKSYKITNSPAREKRPLIHRVIAPPGEKN
jgi:thymidine phosphorylase